MVRARLERTRAQILRGTGRCADVRLDDAADGRVDPPQICRRSLVFAHHDDVFVAVLIREPEWNFRKLSVVGHGHEHAETQYVCRLHAFPEGRVTRWRTRAETLGEVAETFGAIW